MKRWEMKMNMTGWRVSNGDFSLTRLTPHLNARIVRNMGTDRKTAPMKPSEATAFYAGKIVMTLFLVMLRHVSNAIKSVM